MRRQRCRPFTLSDAMLLAAATAIGLALARAMIDHAFWLTSSPKRFADPASALLFALTLAYIPIRLRGPRPSLRRLMRQPGMTACAAVVIVAAIDEMTWMLYGVRAGLPAIQVLSNNWQSNADHIAPAVAAVWLGMLLSRRSRTEPGWIDRFGRLIGLFWLLKLLFGWPFWRWLHVVISLLLMSEP